MKQKKSRRTFIKNSVLGSSGLFLPTGFTNPGPQEIMDKPNQSGFPSTGAHITVENGIPDLYIDGKKSSRMWARLALPSDYAPEKMEQYLPAGIEVYMTAIDTAISLCWDGEDEYFFDKYEAHVRRLVEKKPDIKLILYVGGTGGSPYRWCKNHPEELTLFSTGKRLESASLASEIWKEDSSKAFSEFVRYFMNSKYADNIIGFNPIFNANEWFSHHRKTGAEFGWPDFSRPMVIKFRLWLREKYQSNEALRRSWKDTSVTFETAEIPTADQRLYKENPSLFLNCTPMGNRISDYYLCYDELVADLGIAWCKAIKDASKGQKLAGMMHAYSYCGRFDASIYPQHHGHGAAMKVIRSPYVDFVHSPYHYLNRSIDGTHYSQHAVDTVMNHGKLMVDQIDTKPHLRGGANVNAKTPWESQQLLKRDAMYSLTKNFHCYWLEGGPGDMFPIVRHSPKDFGPLWFDDPQIKETIAQLKALHDHNQQEQNGTVAEVAIFTSMKGTYYQKLSPVYGTLYVELLRQWIMPHTGITFDDLILEDLPNINKKYKVCIFMDVHYMSAELRKTVKTWLDENNTTAIWFYAPGYLDESGCSLANIKELTGIDLAVEDKTSHLQTILAAKDHPYLDKAKDKTFGTDVDPQQFKKDIRWMPWPYKSDDFKLNPVFYASDDQATKLGHLEGSNQPSLVVKDLGNRKSIYSAAPMLPAEIIRNIFKEGGVHVHNDQGELVYANTGYISITAISGDNGAKVVHLPKRQTVHDALSGALIGKNTKAIEVDMRHMETRIFKIT